MASPKYDVDDELGRLYFLWTGKPSAKPSRILMPNDEFDIGRANFHSIYTKEDLTMSTHHIRIHCVIYNDDPECEVPPMVYMRVLSRHPVRITRSSSDDNGPARNVRQGDPDVLLRPGDILRLTKQFSISFSAPERYDLPGLDSIQRAETERFDSQYAVSERKLGAGGQGSVYLSERCSDGMQVACKVVPLPYTNSAHQRKLSLMAEPERDIEMKKIERKLVAKRENLAREFNVLRGLNHPNIISLDKVMFCTYNIYIFQELITAGDLLSYMDLKGRLDEPESAVYARQILQAVNYLHDHGIVHRDIKPENVLMTSRRDGMRIVLTDFGQSRTIDETKLAFRMETTVGTHGYAAPEVFEAVKRDARRKGYSKAIDIWSIGAITATLLTEELLFPHQDGYDEHRVSNQQSSQPDPDSNYDLSVIDRRRSWSDVSRKAKSFVKGCLDLNESRRLTAKQALLHEWFTCRRWAADVEAEYQRIIEDWQPRGDQANLVQFIDTTAVVPANSRPEYVKRIADEAKSKYFEKAPPPFPLTSAPASPHRYPTPQKHVRTPIPQIGRDTTLDSVMVPASPPANTQFDNMFSMPPLPPVQSQVYTNMANETFAKLSLESVGTPDPGFSLQPQSQPSLEQADSVMQR